MWKVRGPRVSGAGCCTARRLQRWAGAGGGLGPQWPLVSSGWRLACVCDAARRLLGRTEPPGGQAAGAGVARRMPESTRQKVERFPHFTGEVPCEGRSQPRRCQPGAQQTRVLGPEEGSHRGAGRGAWAWHACPGPAGWAQGARVAPEGGDQLVLQGGGWAAAGRGVGSRP